MFGKLIDGQIEPAPMNYQGYLNFDKDEQLMRRFGFKCVIEAQREDDKLYTVSYTETENEIIEILIDITDKVKKEERITQLENKIYQLKLMRIDYINESINLATIDSVIRGLAEEQVKLQEEVE